MAQANHSKERISIEKKTYTNNPLINSNRRKRKDLHSAYKYQV